MKKGQIINKLLLLYLLVSSSGCSFIREGVPQWSGSGFIKKEFLEYKILAVLPFEGDFTGEASETFIASLHERFPYMEMVGRRQLLKVFREEDL